MEQKLSVWVTVSREFKKVQAQGMCTFFPGCEFVKFNETISELPPGGEGDWNEALSLFKG